MLNDCRNIKTRMRCVTAIGSGIALLAHFSRIRDNNLFLATSVVFIWFSVDGRRDDGHRSNAEGCPIYGRRQFTPISQAGVPQGTTHWWRIRISDDYNGPSYHDSTKALAGCRGTETDVGSSSSRRVAGRGDRARGV